MNPVEPQNPDVLPAADVEARVVALDHLHDRVATTRRKRSNVEAPAAHTRAYVALQFGYGYARLGRAERARTLIAEARVALASVASDPVHAWLADAYTARIDQAIAGVPPETPLPDPIRSRQLAGSGLDRVVRYKIDRARGASSILECSRCIDPIGRYSNRVDCGQQFDAVSLLPTSAARGSELATLVELAATASNDAERTRLLVGSLDVLFELADVDATPILRRAIAVATNAPIADRAMLSTRALLVADYFGRTELLADLLTGLRAGLPSPPPTGPHGNAPASLDWVIHHSVRVLRRYGMWREIADLAADLERTETEQTPLVARVARAAALAVLGETARAAPILELAVARYQAGMHGSERGDLTRALARAYANMPLDQGLRGIDQLANHFVTVTDSFGTNSHYSIAVLQFVDSLVLGISRD